VGIGGTNGGGGEEEDASVCEQEWIRALCWMASNESLEEEERRKTRRTEEALSICLQCALTIASHPTRLDGNPG